jgi:hypothetical protein
MWGCVATIRDHFEYIIIIFDKIRIEDTISNINVNLLLIYTIYLESHLKISKIH